jgi:SAM-dependent methyltransferase
VRREVIHARVADYYTHRLQEHGPSPRGVDWNSADGQRLRFKQLLRLHETGERFSIVDLGCGYGALAAYLEEWGYAFDYVGVDVSPEMVAAAESGYHRSGVLFTTSDEGIAPADYAVASGIFNVRVGVDDDAWLAYVHETIARLDALSTRGFAFNVLTRFSDPERMRPDLYYADPHALFDHCHERYSRRVALLHDYPLYEFTILVRK